MTDDTSVQVQLVESRIFTLRGQRVMLDSDLADLYGVETKVLLQAVKRNADRFPDDFMFLLSEQEVARLRSQIVTSKGRGGRRTHPIAFTEQGVAMLSSVLRSDRAIRVNVEIMRAFVRMRQMVGMVSDLALRLEDLEEQYDEQFRVVFQAIRDLMKPTPQEPRPAIGFRKDGDHG